MIASDLLWANSKPSLVHEHTNLEEAEVALVLPALEGSHRVEEGGRAAVGDHPSLTREGEGAVAGCPRGD